MEIDVSPLDSYRLKRELADLLRSPQYEPPLLPVVAVELLALTRKPNVGVKEVVALLGQDPFLAGRVLSLARSAQLSSREPPRSLEDAVVRLGLSRITDLFLRVSLEARVFRAPGFAEPMGTLRRHSVFTAEASRVISQATTGLNDYAFLCGLLHDVGIAACILALSGPLRSLAPGSFDDAWPVVREMHEPTSELLGKIWGLPPDITLVLRLHHHPRDGERLHPLAATVELADCFAEELGFGFANDATPAKRRSIAAGLGLNDAALQRLETSLQQLARAMNG